MMSRSRLTVFLLPALAVTALAGSLPSAAPQEVRWKKTVLDKNFRAEGCAIADVNRDGKPDVLAGNLWYEAPGWTPREIRPPQEFNGATGYSNAFVVFADDVDGDRWVDELVVGFPGAKAVWYRNPGRGSNWEEYPITESACNETPHFVDLDGDRHPELITPFQEKQMAFYRPGKDPKAGFEQYLVGEAGKPGCARFSHGLGVGDVNGDKRPDILTNEGYYEQPKEWGRVGMDLKTWNFVPAKLGPACAHMYTHDFDGDGDMDVFSSSAHQIGVWWYEQKPRPGGTEWVQHTIDDTFSQSHSVMKVDVNRDGQPDFITGKRFWAHGPNGDVNPGDPAVLYWFEFKRNGSQVEWTRHEIDNDSGVGTGFAVSDLNGDRRPDIAVANKKGVFVFEQVR
jgi:hypothetical protein